MSMTLGETINYLDSMPGVLALWWFMENVSDEHPHRTDLFFYCRERVRRYQSHRKDELAWDKLMWRAADKQAGSDS